MELPRSGKLHPRDGTAYSHTKLTVALALSKSAEFVKPIAASARKTPALKGTEVAEVQETGAPSLAVTVQEIPVGLSPSAATVDAAEAVRRKVACEVLAAPNTVTENLETVQASGSGNTKLGKSPSLAGIEAPLAAAIT